MDLDLMRLYFKKYNEWLNLDDKGKSEKLSDLEDLGDYIQRNVVNNHVKRN